MWYVIQVLSGTEEKICQSCKSKIPNDLYNEIFCLSYIRKKKYLGEWHEVKEKLFPGYFFIDTKSDHINSIYEKLRDVDGMTKILKSADRITSITSEEEKFLKQLADENYTVSMSIGYSIGEQIEILSGPLKNCSAKIVKVNRHKREATIEVELFGRYTPAQVGLEVIRKISMNEFEEMKKQVPLTPCETGEFIQVRKGIFEGMRGVVKEWNLDKREIKVMLTLFDTPTEVVFGVDEISMI